MKVRTLEYIYKMLCESRITCGVELWGLDEAEKEGDRMHGRFCKKTLGLPRCAVNGMTEMELGTDSRRGKAMWLAVKHWQQIMHMDIQDLVRQCYKCHKGNMRFKSWAKKMKEELQRIGLAYIWHSQQEWDTSRLRRIIRERCNDIERKNLFSIMSEKMSLFYQEMKQKWDREEYIELCSRNERNGLAWMKAGVLKLRGIRRGLEKGTCPLCRGNKHVKHILLSYPETQKMENAIYE
jgi:hypothetical protein